MIQHGYHTASCCNTTAVGPAVRGLASSGCGFSGTIRGPQIVKYKCLENSLLYSTSMCALLDLLS